MKYKIGTIGCGFVGIATSTSFQIVLGDDVEIREYDKFKNSESLESVVENSDILFLCVPTPLKENGCDISVVENVCKQINKLADNSKIIVIKSTVIPGTTEKLSKKYNRHCFVFCPEFLREKTFIEDAINQDRIILGHTDLSPEKTILFNELVSLYKSFTKKQKEPAKIVLSDSKNAEFCKYIINCFLATKLSFFNEMYQICESIGVKLEDVNKLIKLDKRIGDSHMSVPGSDGQFGWSLSCFPKDLNSLMFFAKQNGVDPLILESVWTKNLLVRENHDWNELPQFTGKYDKK